MKLHVTLRWPASLFTSAFHSNMNLIALAAPHAFWHQNKPLFSWNDYPLFKWQSPIINVNNNNTLRRWLETHVYFICLFYLAFGCIMGLYSGQSRRDGDKPLFALLMVYTAFITATQRLVIFSKLLDIYLWLSISVRFSNHMDYPE